jgi:hypothetical protein
LLIFAELFGACSLLKNPEICKARCVNPNTGYRLISMRFVPPKLLRNSEIRLDFLGCFDKEAVATIYTKEDEGRALSVFADSAGAEALGIRAGFREGFEAASVTPEEISKICARHGLALVALYGFLGPGDLSALSVEVVREIFEAAE